MKKTLCIACFLVVGVANAQSSDGSKPAKNQTVNSIERALNSIDSTLSSVAFKIDNSIHDTANFANLRKKIENLSNKLNATTQKIDQKLLNLFPEEKPKNN